MNTVAALLLATTVLIDGRWALEREDLVVTAYVNHVLENGTVDRTTADLSTTRLGLVACDYRWSFGQVFYIPRYGLGICHDRGLLAAHGIDLDVWFPEYQQAIQWGRRTLTVVILIERR